MTLTTGGDVSQEPTGVTVVFAVAELLARLGSGSLAVTLVVLLRGQPEVTFTTIKR